MEKIKCKECLIGRKILVTIAVLVLIRILYFFPLPGVQISAVLQFFQQHIRPQGGNWIDLIALLHIGKLRNISLGSLGIMPFVNACVILQIVGFLVPGFMQKFFSGKDNRKKMMFVTLIIALILSAAHAFLISLDVELLNTFPDFNILSYSGALFKITTVLSLTAMAMLYILLSQIINKFGFGNGVGMIFAVEVIMRVAFAVDQLIVFWGRKMIGPGHMIIFAAITIAFIYFARKITRYLKKIELCTSEGENFSISIRPFWMGIWPLIATEIIFSHLELPLNIGLFLSVCAAIIFFTFLYAKIIYQPRHFYELILKHGCKIQKANSKKIVDHLNYATLRAAILSIFLFIAIYYLPVMLPMMLKVSFISAGVFGTFGLIILVGAHYDIKRQAKFFQKIRSLPLKQWSLLNTAADETEAQIQKATLRGFGIMTEIKPSHFSWGLPIRTAASGYYLYVPYEDKIKAAKLLKDIELDWKSRTV